MTFPTAIDFDTLKWQRLCGKHLLCLDVCVGPGGQSFSWTKLPDGAWCRSLDGTFVAVRDSGIDVNFASSDPALAEKKLRQYFNLDFDSLSAAKKWWPRLSKVDCAIRVIRQEPFETLISFLCSQNNGITRIIRMVHSLLEAFGQLVFEVTFKDSSDTVKVYSFPTTEDLVGKEDLLRQSLGFGYRAKYVDATCRRLGELPSGYLAKLEHLPYNEVVDELVKLPGVGPKVADCIALFGFGKLEAVPIDTHILRVARELRYTTKEGGVLSGKEYRKVGNRFRECYGPYAGWYHSILFTEQIRQAQGGLKN